MSAGTFGSVYGETRVSRSGQTKRLGAARRPLDTAVTGGTPVGTLYKGWSLEWGARGKELVTHPGSSVQGPVR